MDNIITVAAQADPDRTLLAEVEAFLERTADKGMSKTRLGIETMKEGGLVDSLRGGRSLSLKNANKVLTFIRNWRPDGASLPDGADRAQWPLPSAGNGDGISAEGEADSPRPFAPTCATCSPTSAPLAQSPDSAASSTAGAEAA
jgi:hypothetical protein